MTNQELFQEFMVIYFMENGLDQHLALKSLTKQYKKSIFYKHTHYSIYKAFKIFCQAQFNSVINMIISILNPSELAEKVNLFLDDLDMDKIDHILNKILTELDATSLIKDKEYLTQAIERLKS